MVRARNYLSLWIGGIGARLAEDSCTETGRWNQIPRRASNKYQRQIRPRLNENADTTIFCVFQVANRYPHRQKVRKTFRTASEGCYSCDRIPLISAASVLAPMLSRICVNAANAFALPAPNWSS